MPELINTQEELEKFLADGEKETLYNEFKSSAAMSRQSAESDEMCRDVSAFANSGGGQVIYGVSEDKKAKKYSLDTGVSDTAITREWIEAKLNSNIHPAMHGLRVFEFPISRAGRAFVIQVQATTNGPHQAPDRKYYRRTDTGKSPMTDREIRDVMGRSLNPDLDVDLSWGSGKVERLLYPPRDEISRGFTLGGTIANRSPAPSMYTQVMLGVDPRFNVYETGGWVSAAQLPGPTGAPLNWFKRNISIPDDMPIFKEAPQALSPVSLFLQLGSQHLSVTTFNLAVAVLAPGFSSSSPWIAVNLGGTLQLQRVG